ncbi:RsiV family protein [Bacillus sp. SL00103]
MNYVLTKKKTKQVFLTDVVKTKKKRTKVRDYIYNYTKKHKSKFYANLKKRETLKSTTTHGYYFTKKGIAVVFQPYEISPYYVGIPVIQVPAKVYK